jgi:hypothetical protein
VAAIWAALEHEKAFQRGLQYILRMFQTPLRMRNFFHQWQKGIFSQFSRKAGFLQKGDFSANFSPMFKESASGERRNTWKNAAVSIIR